MAKSLAIERSPLWAAQTTGSTRPIGTAGRDQIVFYFTGTGTLSSGTIVIEEADYSPGLTVYAGTWSQIGNSILCSSFTGGAQLAVHLPSPAAYHNVRARFTVNAGGGGTVDCAVIAQ